MSKGKESASKPVERVVRMGGMTPELTTVMLFRRQLGVVGGRSLDKVMRRGTKITLISDEWEMSFVPFVPAGEHVALLPPDEALQRFDGAVSPAILATFRILCGRDCKGRRTTPELRGACFFVTPDEKIGFAHSGSDRPGIAYRVSITGKPRNWKGYVPNGYGDAQRLRCPLD